MAGRKLIGFSDNFADNSTEAGFQFTFFCDNCREGYKTRFVESRTHRKGKFFRNIGRIAGTAAQMTGQYKLGHGLTTGGDVLSERHQGMTPEWHKEHEIAFEQTQNEIKEHFERCPKCTHWVCENCWNEQQGLCVTCAPRESVEVAAARADKMVADIREKAAKTQVFTGKIESKQTICPQCGKPAGEGKFCNNCGAALGLQECPKCGAEFPAGTRFCGECGTKLG